jgi:hypothetical protein
MIFAKIFAIASLVLVSLVAVSAAHELENRQGLSG